jgi:glycosyltransferase involved in cell wall biosynthesis
VRPLVLHVAEFRNPAGGGFVAGLARLAQRHQAFETALLCPSAGYAWMGVLNSAGVRVHVAQHNLEVAKAVAQLRPTIVHAHFLSWSVAAMLGGAAARARVAWHFHSGLANGMQPNLVRRLKYAAARRLVDRFYCVSPDLVEYLQRLRVPQRQIVELPNGVDLDRFHPPTSTERADARRAFSLGPRDRAVAFFGREALVKGSDRLAAALRSMHSPPVVIAIACSAQSLELLGTVKVLDAGQMSDVRVALWAADAIALPSRSEGIPYALLEARGCGLPAVVAPLPGTDRALAGDAGTTTASADEASVFGAALERALELGRTPLSPVLRARISLDAWSDSLASWYLEEAAA